jgi:hypothetical protein
LAREVPEWLSAAVDADGPSRTSQIHLYPAANHANWIMAARRARRGDRPCRNLGVISRIDIEEGELDVDVDSREATYGFGELDKLVLAYAMTIHKRQGSEYPAVVFH